MTTLRRERRQKFAEIIRKAVYTYYGVYMDESEVERIAAELSGAAESRTEKLTPAEIAQVDKKVDAIIGQAREAQSRIDSGTGWRGRELLPAQYVAYGDWWYAKTGLHMYGAKAKAKVDSGWLKAFKELYENDVTIASLDEAMKSNEWRTISNPAQIVNDAKAIQAAPKSVQSSQRPELEKYTPDDPTQFVPRPK